MGTTKDFPKQSKTEAFTEIMEVLEDAVEKKIYDKMQGFGVSVSCGASGYVSKSEFCTAKNTDKTFTGDLMKVVRGHFMPLKVQVLNDHVISATQNKLDTIKYDDDDAGEDESSSSSGADGTTTITDEDGNKVTVTKNGYVYTDPTNNDQYFQKADKSYVDITDGTCLINEENPAVITRGNPLINGDGDGYLVIENDSAESLSQYYYPDENGQINFDFVPDLISDEEGDYSTTE